MKFILILLLLSFVTAPAFGFDRTGLVGYWKMDEDKNLIKDESGKRNNGNIAGKLKWTPGVIGGAFDFDGHYDNKIIVPYSGSLDIKGNENLTMLAWIRLRTCPSQGVFFEVVKHLSGNKGYQLEINGNHNCTVRANIKGLTRPFTSNSKTNKGTPLLPGTWYLIGGGRDAENIWTSVNGEIDISQPSTGQITANSQRLGIGGQMSPGSGGTSMNGLIDEVYIFTRALTEKEILGIYNEGISSRPAPSVSVSPSSVH